MLIPTDFLYGPPIGTESPRGLTALYDRLDKILPGIRMKRRLSALPTQTHQAVADFLGDQGFLNPRVMTMLRTSEIRALSMTESMDEESGLNIGSRDIIKVFNEPNSFTFLTYLSFSGCRVLDMDIMYIQHLPKLAILLLNNTGISNEAVYSLTSLKRTLTHLNLATNPHIDNDAIPALLILKKLSFFSILDTGVDVVGLRRLARVIHDEERIVDVEIPDEGERYLNCIHSKYLVKIQPPLISRPGMCAQASAAALKRNLQAHAEVNPVILAAGTKAEMRDRLEGILKTREADLVLYEMVLGSVKEEEEEEEEEGESD
ncbi:hypothetical protein CYLTODRAFT_352175 [Cylindrobasidium torrendii FP15055 ss-10]|uniref:RNI-like protein n=1 Tax=Cylindrobasidium torrendii FP15055 ss-10 TaxID=1314674 RepID=A0A0D7BCN6_9AGAR|nr:hypothetical protein CYLTODRAFT_352175 [Cylindrobasidium torrendii FP15055 ss-10]